MFPLNNTVASPSHIGLDLIGIQPGAPLDLDLRVESVSEGVLVSGTLSAPITGECSRCLTPFTERIEVDLTELYAYPDSITDTTTDEDEVGRVVDDMIDLEQPVIDAIGLELPFSPVCRAGLPGTVPQVRRGAGERRTRSPPRRDRRALVQACRHAAPRLRRGEQ